MDNQLVLRVLSCLGAGLWLSLGSAAPVGQGRITADAVSGGRFGVGRIMLPLPREVQPPILGVEGLVVTERNGRALYPAIGKPPLGGLVTDLFNRPQPITVYFLFQGDGPLEMSLQGASSLKLTIVPRQEPLLNRRLLQEWWNVYTAPPRLLERRVDYVPLVDNYLKTMLARRLSLKLPPKEQRPPWQEILEHELGLMLGTETIRMAMQQDRILGMSNLDQPADQALPQPVIPESPKTPAVPDDVQIEPLALRVPAECFYLRFGSFSNFLWFQDTMAKWGGDWSNLVAARGLNYDLTQQMEDRLVLKTSALARWFGDAVVDDVALIGSDMFFREGAAFGVLFHARQSKLFAADVAGQRAERLKGGGVNEQNLEIAGHRVSLLSSPDGRVRSFYLADGDYHFVTTSKTLAHRFLETVSGKAALGSSPDFRFARSVLPIGRKDTVFAYLSDAFFQNITGPHYRVEMGRRLQAGADIELVQLAKLAAATEAKPGDTIAQLIESELLPEDFGPRPDGSRTLIEEGEVFDSLRGHRGAMLPVPDVQVTKITPAEAAAYDRFSDFFHQKWGRLDPVMAAVKRQELPGNREQVVLDVRVSPLALQHFQFLTQWVGPPSQARMTPIPGYMAMADVVLRTQRIFGGLVDARPPLEMVAGRPLPVGRLRDILVGFVGFTGQPGLLAYLNEQSAGPADERGFARGRLGLWRRELGEMTLFSFQPEVLDSAGPQLKFVPAERPAQWRMWVGDLSQARVAAFLNDWGYLRTRDTSLGNLRLMNVLDQQLHVPAPDCKEAAEFLLGAKMVCPLGGQYVLKKTPDGHGWWTSTALGDVGPRPLTLLQAPAGYQVPPLNWFRGLDLDALMTEPAIAVHAEVIMQMPVPKKTEPVK